LFKRSKEVHVISIRQFDAATFSEASRLTAWSTFLAAQKCKAMLVSAPENFVGRMTLLTTPWQFSLITLQISAQRLTFDSRAQAGGVWVIHAAEGSGTLRTERGDVAFAAGDVLYGRVPREVSVTTASRARLQCVFFPQNRMAARLATIPAPMVGSTLKLALGSTAFLSGLMQSATDRIETLTGDDVRPLEIAITEFFVAAVSSTAAASSVLEGSRGKNAIAIRATQVIEAQLSDSELSPATIAEQLGISVRYLQKLFEEAGENVNHYVRRRRLERSYDDLMDPVYFGQSISEISFRWGFNDSAYFSRAFRDLFGTTPSQHRADRRWQDASDPKEQAEKRPSRAMGFRTVRA
jgi:AraC-like DNA-binding protein